VKLLLKWQLSHPSSQYCAWCCHHSFLHYIEYKLCSVSPSFF
jgi:hypothetical protein